MEQFEAIPKKWGNSLGITIPSEIVAEENIKPKKKITVLILGDRQKIRDIFGTLKLKRPVQEIMGEIDQGYDGN